MSQQNLVFMWSLVMGALLAAVYTLFAMLRAVSPPGRKLMTVLDFLFSAVAGAVNFLFALSLTGGRIRGYVLLTELLSFLLLYLTVGRLLCRSAGWIRKVTEGIFGRLTAPFRRLSVRLCGSIRQQCQKLLKKFKKD